MREVKVSRFSGRLTVLSMGVAAVLGAQAASAATVTDMPSSTLQTITVTANSSVRESVQEGGVDVEGYTPAAQASHLSDFLNVVPGVTVGGTSAVNQRIRVRGLDDTNLKVTIDGARQEGTLFYHMGDVTIDPDLLKQAEVSVGNNSVTLGNDALGGAVAFKTVDAADLLKPGQKIGAKLHAGYASNNDELLTSATVFAAPTANTDLLAYYGQRNADAGEDGEGRPIQTEDSKGENILLKAGAYIATDHHLGASFSRTENEGRFPLRPDFPASPGVGSWNEILPQRVKRDTYGLDYTYNPVSNLVNVDTNVYQTETQISRDTDYTTNPGYNWEAGVKTTGAKIQNTSVIDTNVGSHKLIAGVEHYKKESELERDFVKKGTDEAKNTSIYLEDQWKNGKLTLTPGVRYDRYKSPEFVSAGKTYNNVVGALAASYEIAPMTQVFASYTQLFNGPDLSQAIFNSDGDKTYVNSDLKAEEGSNAEIGIVKTLRDLTVAGDALQLSGKYFETDIENFIEFVRSGDKRPGLDCTTGQQGTTSSPKPCQGAVNKEEDYKIKGVELAADYKMENFSMGLSYAHARSKGDKTGYSIPSITGGSADSGDKYMVNLAYEPTDTTELGWRSTYVAAITPKTESAQPEKSNYDVHDIFMSYMPKQVDGLKATVGVYNIFDETYASHASRSLEARPDGGLRTDFEPGRNIKASLSYQF